MNTLGVQGLCTVDNKVYGVWGRSFWFIDLPEGRHSITSGGIKQARVGGIKQARITSYGKYRVDFDLKVGETKYCRINLASTALVPRGTPVMVDPSTATEELTDLPFYGDPKTTISVDR